MKFNFKCSNCDAAYSAEPKQVGSKGKCQKCGQRIEVPKVCPNCAKAIEKAANFCSICGYNLLESNITQKEKQLIKKEKVNSQTTKTTSCPACKHEVSKNAVSCPKCGHPFKKTAQGMSGCGLFFLIVAAIIIAVILMSLGL